MSWEGLLVKRFKALSEENLFPLAGLTLFGQVPTKRRANQAEKKAVEF